MATDLPTQIENMADPDPLETLRRAMGAGTPQTVTAATNSPALNLLSQQKAPTALQTNATTQAPVGQLIAQEHPLLKAPTPVEQPLLAQQPPTAEQIRTNNDLAALNKESALQTLQDKAANIKNPVGRAFGETGAGLLRGIVGGIGALFPEEAFIPGTDLNNIAEKNRARKDLESQAATQNETADANLRQGQADALKNPLPKTDEERYITDYKTANPGTTDEEALKSYSAAKATPTPFSVWNNRNPTGDIADYFRDQLAAKPGDNEPLTDVDALQKGLADRWNVIHPGPLPEQYQLGTNPTVGDYKRREALLTAVEQATQAQTNHQDAMANTAATRAATAANQDTTRGFQETERGRSLLDKADDTYRTATQGANGLRDMVGLASTGNKVAAQMLPLEGALEITTAQGVRRINKTEVEQFEGAGSLWDKVQGKLGKQAAGQPIPADLFPDIRQLATLQQAGAYLKYKNAYDSTIRRYGLNDETAPPPSPELQATMTNYYLKQANGNADKAKSLAKSDGW